jgi:hypothetical protein
MGIPCPSKERARPILQQDMNVEEGRGGTQGKERRSDGTGKTMARPVTRSRKPNVFNG